MTTDNVHHQHRHRHQHQHRPFYSMNILLHWHFWVYSEYWHCTSSLSASSSSIYTFTHLHFSIPKRSKTNKERKRKSNKIKCGKSSGRILCHLKKEAAATKSIQQRMLLFFLTKASQTGNFVLHLYGIDATFRQISSCTSSIKQSAEQISRKDEQDTDWWIKISNICTSHEVGNSSK